MQNLIIVGERYKVKHPYDYWSGEVTVDGITADGDIKVKDVKVYGDNAKTVLNYFHTNLDASLNGEADWNWELLNFTLENE